MVDILFRNSPSLKKFKQNLLPQTPPKAAKENQRPEKGNDVGAKRKSTGTWAGFTPQQRELAGLGRLNRKNFISVISQKKRTIFGLLHNAIFTVDPGDGEYMKFLPYTGPYSIFSIYCKVIKPPCRLSPGNYNVVWKRQFRDLADFDQCLHNVRHKCPDDDYAILQPDGLDVSKKITVVERISLRKLNTPSSRLRMLARLERVISESKSGISTSPFAMPGDDKTIAEAIIEQIESSGITQQRDIFLAHISNKDRRGDIMNSPSQRKRSRSAPNTPVSKKFRKKTTKVEQRLAFIQAANHPAIAVTLARDDNIETIIEKVKGSIRLPENEYVLCFENNVLVTDASQLIMGHIFQLISKDDMLSAWAVQQI